MEETDRFSEADQKWMRLALEQAALAAQAGEVPVGAVLVKDGERMVVGVRNHFGDICLKIETSGEQEYMNVISCLDGRELSDELAEADGPKDGYDAIFS